MFGLNAYKKPSVKLLGQTIAVDTKPTAAAKQTADNLQKALSAYGIPGAIVGIRPGPIVTVYEFKPESGVRIADIRDLTEDLTRELAANHIRIASVPGANYIAIEVQNARPHIVRCGTQIADKRFEGGDHRIPLALGILPDGVPVYFDLAQLSHLLIAGRTGAGKSVFIQSIIMSLVYRFTPDECKLLIIDPKGVDFEPWHDIPHLITPIVNDADTGINALKWVVREMDRRYEVFQSAGAHDIESYNKSADTRMPYLVVVVDELTDLMATAQSDAEASVHRIAQKARATGIHLILATQRPDANTIPGIIKVNLPTRVAFQARNGIDSMTILGDKGAENLLPFGDMLFSEAGRAPIRIHTAFVSDDEITAVADHLRKQGKPQYVNGVTDETSTEAEPADLYNQVRELIIRDRKPTISYIQRRFNIGYNKACDLMERMERDGIVSAPDENGKRHIIEK